MTTGLEDFRNPTGIQDRATQCLDVSPAHLRWPHCQVLGAIRHRELGACKCQLGLRSRSACSILAARSKSSKRRIALDQWLSKEQERALSDGTKNPTDS